MLLGMYQVDQLASVQCATAEVRQSYKHKHLKTAFAHLPQSKEITTAMGTKARTWQPCIHAHAQLATGQLAQHVATTSVWLHVDATHLLQISLWHSPTVVTRPPQFLSARR